MPRIRLISGYDGEIFYASGFGWEDRDSDFHLRDSEERSVGFDCLYRAGVVW
jgi:hypothetical protein